MGEGFFMKQMDGLKSILILCTANRCRSQMAEGWVRHYAPNEVAVYSAGVRATFVHPLAIEVMAERGIDLWAHRSEHLSRYLDKEIDLVVTVCDSAREQCPVLPRAKRTLHQRFDDPDAAEGSDAEVLGVFRRVRDEIEAWAKSLF